MRSAFHHITRLITHLFHLTFKSRRGRAYPPEELLVSTPAALQATSKRIASGVHCRDSLLSYNPMSDLLLARPSLCRIARKKRYCPIHVMALISTATGTPLL